MPSIGEEKFVFDDVASQQQFEKCLKEFRCVTCANQSIAESGAPVATAMREEIYRRVKAGETPESIQHYLLSAYGDYVLYKPRMQRETWVLWLAPFLVLGIGIVVWMKMGRRSS